MVSQKERLQHISVNSFCCTHWRIRHYRKTESIPITAGHFLGLAGIEIVLPIGWLGIDILFELGHAGTPRRRRLGLGTVRVNATPVHARSVVATDHVLFGTGTVGNGAAVVFDGRRFLFFERRSDKVALSLVGPHGIPADQGKEKVDAVEPEGTLQTIIVG